MLLQQVIYPAAPPGAAASTHTVPLDQPATAGSTLIILAAAPAVITIPGAIKRGTNVSNADVSIFSMDMAGGETSIQVNLSGPRRLQAVVLERDDIDAFITAVGRNQAPSGSWAFNALAMNEGDHVFVALGAIHHISLAGEAVGPWTPPLDEHLDRILGAAVSGDEDVWLAAASGTAPSTGNLAYSATGLLASGPIQQGVIAVFSNSGGSLPPPENPVEAENREQGSAGWDIDGAGDPGIQGFATAMSVEQGGTLDLKIHSGGAPFDVAIYRLGYYNGAGARLIDTVTGTPTTQPTGTIDPTTLMASCASWTVSASWTVPPDACPGVYLARPVLGGGGASHIPFVVRNPARKAPILVVTSDSTWQAYNHAGANPADPFNGRSLYGAGTAASFVFNLSQRCRAVSYDRPWVTREHLPQTWLFNSEYPAIRWLERNGYDVDYASCPDIDADPSLLTGRQIVIVHGHSEYWSATMWDNLVAARDAGVHLIIAAGNELFWRIRWDGGRRTYACWKDSMDGQLNPTGLYSGTWQDTRAFNPQRRSPATVTGQFFRVNGLHEFALTVPDAYAAHPIWRDTTVAELGPGESRSYPGLIGFETDEDREQERPPGWVRLSETTFTVTNLISNENGNDYSGSGTVTHHMGAYQAPSGAVVLGVGTVQLAWGLDAWHDRTVRPAQPDIQQMVMNLLADMGVQCPDASRQVDLVKPVPVDFSEYGFGSAPAAATLHGGGLMSAVGIKSVTMTARLSGGALAAAAATPGPSLTMTAAMAGGGILAARGTPGAPVAGPARLRSSAAPVATLRGSDS